MPTDDLPQHDLRTWRERKFLSQAELARRVEVDPHTVSDWETGKKEPQRRNIRKLAEVLGIQPEQIIFVKDDPAAA